MSFDENFSCQYPFEVCNKTLFIFEISICLDRINDTRGRYRWGLIFAVVINIWPKPTLMRQRSTMRTVKDLEPSAGATDFPLNLCLSIFTIVYR